MATYQTIDKIEYTPKEIRLAHPKIKYFVVMPQGVSKKYKDGSGSFNTSGMYARTLRKARQLAVKYKAAWIERELACKLGTWSIKIFSDRMDDDCKNLDELWDKYKK